MGSKTRPARLALATGALSLWIGLGLVVIGPGPATESPARLAAPHNCRFWGSVSDSIPAAVIEDHLLNLDNCLQNLSRQNRNGWSVAFYPAGDPAPIVRRGQLAAHLDTFFDVAVAKTADASPAIAVSHVRFCTSGLCGIPNPHPFQRTKNGKHWLMGHNGTIDKNILLGLIRPDYLAANPPHNGQDPTEWIDSELYFLYLLQTCADFGWQVKEALGEVIRQLRDLIPEDREQLNLFLSDGTTLWAYREGPDLYYLDDDSGTPFSAVASQFPSATQETWVEMQDGQLVTLRTGQPAQVEWIESYFDLTPPPDPLAAGLALRNFPNPFNPATTIRFSLPRPAPVSLRVFDVSGRLVRELVAGIWHERGEHAVPWDGTDDTGRAAASGVYMCRLEAGLRSEAIRLALIR